MAGCVFEPVKVRADQRVDARVVLHDGEGAGVGEHVAGNLRPVDDPSGIVGELVEKDVLTAGVRISERVDRGRLSPDPGQPVRERIRIQAAQVVAGGELPEGTLGLGDDELRATVRDAGAAGMGVGVAYLYWWTAYIVSEYYSSSISGRCASLPQNAIKVSIPNPLLEPSVGHLCPVFVTTARGSAKACRATEGVAFLKILHFALKLSRLAT